MAPATARIHIDAPPIRVRTRRVTWHHRDIRLTGPVYEAWPSARMTTTGQAAWCVTLLLTEPIRSEVNPPLPRDPTTTISAPCDALTSSSAGSPVTTFTVT